MTESKQLLRSMAVAVAAVVALGACGAQVPSELLASGPSSVPRAVTTTIPTAQRSADLPGGEATDPAVSTSTSLSTTTSLSSTTSTTVAVVPETTSTTTTTVPEGPRVTEQSRSDESVDPAFQVEAHWPELVGLADEDIQSDINSTIAETVANIVDPWLADLVAFLAEFPPPGGATSYISIESEVTILDERLIAVRLAEENFVAGATDANRKLTTFVFDLADGERLELIDVLVSGDVLEQIEELVIERLVAEYHDGNESAFAVWAGRAIAEKFTHFTLTPTSLDIGFNQFEVGPATVGTPIVSIPFDQLVGLIDPAGPAGHLLG